MMTPMAWAKAAKREQRPQPPPTKPRTAPGPEAAVLRMDLQIGDRFMAEGFEWLRPLLPTPAPVRLPPACCYALVQASEQ